MSGEITIERGIDAKINDHRDDLEALAASDLPCAEIAATLLEVGKA